MDTSKGGEFDLIQTIITQWGSARHKDKGAPSAILVGMGDDAAAVMPESSKALLLTTDTLMEGVHFDRSFSTFVHVGYKAIHVNVSDIAAMGGRPLYSLVSLGISKKEKQVHIHQLYQGMHQAGREMNLRLMGGNIVRSDKFFISITLVGDAPPKKIITRSQGTPGDILYVTGTLGDAAAGLEILKTKWAGRPSDIRFLTQRHRMPQARWSEGHLMAEEQIPSAMIDLSDGLGSDLHHLARQSGTGVEIDPEQIPISPPLARYAKTVNKDALSYALYGGEDYELLFSVPEKKKKKLDALIARGAIHARCIGRLVEKRKGLLIKDKKSTRPLEPRGYDHLKESGE